MRTDAELLGCYVRERSEAAFAQLVERHVGMVYSAALRHVGGDVHLAQDVAQTVFVALARKARTLEGRGGLAGWLYLGAHHAAAQCVRAERRRKTREEAHAMHEQLMGGAENAEWERLRPVLDAAMRELSEADREAVLLRFFERRPFAQVGAALNVSEDAARMRVERALDKLRTLLGRYGITSTGAALGAALTAEAGVVAPAAVVREVTRAALRDAGVKTAAANNGIFSTMNTTLGVVGAVAVVAIGGAVYQAREARRADEASLLAAKERDAARAQLQVVQANAREVERRLVAADEQIAALKAEAARSAPAAGSAKGALASGRDSGNVMSISAVAADGTTKGTMHFVDSPEGRRAASREVVAKSFAAFFRKMGWSEQQQALFKELWADRKEAGQQMFQQALANGERGSKELARRVAEETGREFDVKVKAAFGDGAVEAMRDYEAKGAFRHVADELAKRLFYSDTPLSHVQADALAEIMANNARTPAGKFDIATMNHEAVLAQAQGILSPPQVAALREVEAEQRRQRELEERARAERAAGPARPPGR